MKVSPTHEFTVETTNDEGKTVKLPLKSNAWGFFEAVKRLPKIGKAFAVPISMVFSSKDEESFSEAIPTALFMLFENMETEDVVNLFKMITDHVYLMNGDNQIVDLEEVSGADLNVGLEIVAEALIHNYGCLFTGKGLSRLMKPLAEITQLQESNPVKQP